MYLEKSEFRSILPHRVRLGLNLKKIQLFVYVFICIVRQHENFNEVVNPDCWKRNSEVRLSLTSSPCLRHFCLLHHSSWYILKLVHYSSWYTKACALVLLLVLFLLILLINVQMSEGALLACRSLIINQNKRSLCHVCPGPC